MSTGLRVFGTSIPKSGTHLLSAVFENMGYHIVECRKDANKVRLAQLGPEATTGTRNIFACGHWRCRTHHKRDLREHRYEIIVLIRDPRDICLSMADFFRTGQPRLYSKLDPSLQHLTQKELVKKFIDGFTVHHRHKPIQPIAKVCSGWLEWQRFGAVVLKYEDLARQEQRPIAEVERIGIDPSRFLMALGQAYGNPRSVTLNKATVGRWQTEFDDELKEVWRKRASGLATLLGYEET